MQIRTRVNFYILISGFVLGILNMLEFSHYIISTILVLGSIVGIAAITVKFKESKALIACLLGTTISLLNLDIVQAFIKLILISIIGISIGYCIRNKVGLKTRIIIGGASGTVAFIIINLLLKWVFGINYLEEIYINKIPIFFDFLAKNQEKFKELLTGIINGEITEIPINVLPFEAWWRILLVIHMTILISLIGGGGLGVLYLSIPGAILVLSTVIVSLLMCSSESVVKRLWRKEQKETLSDFTLPFEYGLIFIVVQLLMFINKTYNDYNIINSILLNMMIILNFGFLIQGLAVFENWLKAKKTSKAIRSTIYILGMLILFPITSFVLMIFVIVGILDYLFNLRGIQTK